MTYQDFLLNNYENKFYVYIYFRGNLYEKGKPRYVGKGSGKRAWVKHFSYCQVPINHNLIEIIPNLSEEEALNLEIELIKKYGRIDSGTGCLYNKTDGGENPPSNNWDKPEYREKMTQRLKGMWQNPEFRSKRLKQLQSEEFREQARVKATGKVRSQESINKTKFSLFKPIISMNVTTLERKEFSSISAACDHFGCSGGAISNILSGSKKSCYGHTFVYTEDADKLDTFSMKRAKQKTNLTPVIATKISTGEEFAFNSIADCKKELNLTAVGDVLSGRQSQTGGYRIRRL